MKTILKKSVLFLGVLALVAGPVGRYAPENALAAGSYQSAIDKAEKEKQELEKMKEEMAEKIAALNEDKSSTEEYLRQVDEELSLAYETMEELNREIEGCQTALEETEKELADAVEMQNNQYATMKARIKYMYENGDTSIWELLVDADSLEDLLNQVEYRSQIAAYDDELLKRYQATCKEVEQKEEQYANELVILKSAKDKQQVQIDGLNEMVLQKAKYVEELSASLGISQEQYFEYYEEIESKELEISELKEKERKRIEEEERKRKEEEERRRKEEEERKRREEEERKRQEEEKKKQQQQQQVVLSGTTDIRKMIWPFPTDHNIYSYYGSRTSPITHEKEFHSGIDIGGAYGADIVAALAGKVITAKWSTMNGYHIVIDSGNGVTTHYLHSSKLLVDVGDYVQQGQVIMKCGSTGWSTAPHLHFTVKINGNTVDPLDYVRP